jgi:hypothetical protein
MNFTQDILTGNNSTEDILIYVYVFGIIISFAPSYVFAFRENPKGAPLDIFIMAIIYASLWPPLLVTGTVCLIIMGIYLGFSTCRKKVCETNTEEQLLIV